MASSINLKRIKILQVKNGKKWTYIFLIPFIIFEVLDGLRFELRMDSSSLISLQGFMSC